MNTARIAAPKPVAPMGTWTPSHLDLSARLAPMPEVEADIAARLDLRAPASGVTIDPTKVDARIYAAGQLVDEQSITAAVTPDERTAMLGIRDALAGSEYLADARPFADGPAALDMMRFSWTNRAGEQQMLELPASQPAEGYEALYTALENYAQVAALTPGA